jgi:hypothetical protein
LALAVRLRRLFPLVFTLAFPACHEKSDSTTAPIVCAIDRSDSCLRCQAQHCGVALDTCYGPGFHEGRSVGGGPSTDASGEGPDVPCGVLAACLQACGCRPDCRAMCLGGQATTYFANDPRLQLEECTACESGTLAACARRACFAECRSGDAGAD